MTIPCNLYPLGTPVSPYKPNEVLCDLENGQSQTVTLYPGMYYVRAQGAGGWGNAAGWGDGYGGGSGAGFDGTIRITKKLQVTVKAGICPDNRTKGEDTYIGSLMVLGGGGLGVIGSSGDPKNGGKLTISSDCKIISYTVKSDGKGGIIRGGGNSVLTNSGGGASHSNATAPGAGGGGSYGYFSGGKGYYGECLIKFVRP